jgi:hypothetical protein
MFRFRTLYVQGVDSAFYDANKDNYYFVWRKGQIPENAKADYPEQNYTLPPGPSDNQTEVTNWDGEKVVLNKPWIDKVLFKIGDIEITAKDAVIGAGGIVGIVLAVVAVCAFISWRKRK